MSKYGYKKFSSYIHYTKTLVICTNITLNIDSIFFNKVLPITEYTEVKKKRGRKKKDQSAKSPIKLKTGDIIQLRYKKIYQGVPPTTKTQTTKKKKPTQTKHFKNAINCKMYCGDRFVTVKINKQGGFHFVGCKSERQAELCVLYLWKYIRRYKQLYTFTSGTNLTMIFDPAMSNISFTAGYKIDIDAFYTYINDFTDYIAIHPEDLGYTGIRVKVPFSRDKFDLKQKEYIYKPVKNTVTSYISYNDFLKISKKKDKKKYISFMVFQSGKILMSGPHPKIMKNVYYKFVKILYEGRDFFKHV